MKLSASIQMILILDIHCACSLSELFITWIHNHTEVIVNCSLERKKIHQTYVSQVHIEFS